MVKMTCKCKKSEMTFPKLEASDFPNGWENECCSKASKEEAPAPEEVKEEEAPVEEAPAPELKKKKAKRAKKDKKEDGGDAQGNSDI